MVELVLSSLLIGEGHLEERKEEEEEEEKEEEEEEERERKVCGGEGIEKA